MENKENHCEIIMMPAPDVLMEDDIDNLLLGMINLLEKYGTVEQMLGFIQKIEELVAN